MLKFGKGAIPFTRLTCVVPRSWAFLVTLPSVPIATVTSPVKPGTRRPDVSSAATSTWNVSDCALTVDGGWIVKASCVAGGVQATLNVVRAVSFGGTATVRGLAPLTLQLPGTPPSAARWLPAGMPAAGVVFFVAGGGVLSPPGGVLYAGGGVRPPPGRPPPRAP